MCIYIYTIIMWVHSMVRIGHIVEGTRFHCICDGCIVEGISRLGMMQPLGLHTSVSVLIQLLCLAGRLMCNESSCRFHESDCMIGWL